MAREMSGGNMKPSQHVTISNDPSSKSDRSVMYATCTDMFGSVAVVCSARATWWGEISVPTTVARENCRAIDSAGSPGPVARSRTVNSGPWISQKAWMRSNMVFHGPEG